MDVSLAVEAKILIIFFFKTVVLAFSLLLSSWHCHQRPCLELKIRLCYVMCGFYLLVASNFLQKMITTL